MNYQNIAGFLKYAGLVAGTASSIWGAVNELKREGKDGRKHLTKAGISSIMITVISFGVSITSAALGDKLAREAQKKAEDNRQAEIVATIQRHQDLISQQQLLLSQQLDSLSLSEKTRAEQHKRFDELTRQEARSTNAILIAGQSLRDISLTWKFPYASSIYQKLSRQTDSDVAELDDEWGFDPHQDAYYAQRYQLNYDHAVRTFLNQLGREESADGSALALFSLDNSASIVLPMGFVDVLQVGPTNKIANNVAAGIELLGSDAVPTQKRRFGTRSSLPQVDQYLGGLALSWHLSGADSARAIDKADPSLIAVLPSEMRVMVLTRMKQMPVNPENTSEVTYPWPMWSLTSQGKDLTPNELRGSQLRVVPNGVEQMAATYEMKLVQVNQLSTPEEHEDYARAALWIGKRAQTAP